MKVALVHDYIKEYGGAERVLEALHEIWPEAPVFTTVYLPEFLGPHQNRFKSWNIKTSFLQHLPFKEKLISPFRIIAPLVFRQFDFSQFDVVIVSSTGAYTSNLIDCHPDSERSEEEGSRDSSSRHGGTQNDIKKKPVHICYCHTPPRYLYGYPTARDWKRVGAIRVIGGIMNHFLRLVDFKAAQNVVYFISNSKEVASRIKKFYRRDAIVIYPPVGIDDRKWRVEDSNLKMEDRSLIHPLASNLKNLSSIVYHPSSKEKYFLAGGRLARPKHIDLIVKTCAELGVPLKVFGRGFAGSPNILISKYPNIQFVGEVSDEEKLELMRNAKAYIFAAEDEDFGITPVEAMSAGTPVVAYRSGGVVESVVEGKTGIFFDELTVDSLAQALKCFNDSNHDIKPEDCLTQSQKFSKERFKREILEFVEKKKKLV